LVPGTDSSVISQSNYNKLMEDRFNCLISSLVKYRQTVFKA